jgi:hypothetical protein
MIEHTLSMNETLGLIFGGKKMDMVESKTSSIIKD